MQIQYKLRSVSTAGVCAALQVSYWTHWFESDDGLLILFLRQYVNRNHENSL